MDCEKLSPNALKIFEKIKKYYPNDPWDNLRWSQEGLVFFHGWHDLRKSENRHQLIKEYELQVGSMIVMFAKIARERNQDLTPSVFRFKMSRKWIELAVLLHELDFQIETLD